MYSLTNPFVSEEFVKAPFGKPSPKIALPANFTEEINSPEGEFIFLSLITNGYGLKRDGAFDI